MYLAHMYVYLEEIASEKKLFYSIGSITRLKDISAACQSERAYCSLFTLHEVIILSSKKQEKEAALSRADKNHIQQAKSSL